MPADSSIRSDRPSLAHSHRSAPDTPSRSTIFQPEPPHAGQTSSAMNLHYPLPGALLNGRQNRARGDGFTLTHRDRGHTSRPSCLHFVLHLHGLDYYYALTGRHRITGLHQYAHDLAGHGSENGLAVVTVRGGAAFGPPSGIGDGDAETPAAHGDPDAIVTWFRTSFVTTALKQHGKYTRLDFCEMGLALGPVAKQETVSLAIAMHFQARGHAVDLNVKGHCSTSSRPARRQAAPALRPL